MTPEIQVLLTVSVPTLAVLIGILINNSRINDVNLHMSTMQIHFDKRLDGIDKRMDGFDKRIDELKQDLKDTWRAELRRVEEVLDAR
jgi:hypothetical protein